MIPALGRLKQVNLCDFKARLVHRFQDSQGCYTEKPCLEKQKRERKGKTLDAEVLSKYLATGKHKRLA